MISGTVHEEERDFSKFLAIPDEEEERRCYETFYDATSNEVLTMRTCPVCAREKFKKDGEDSWSLSNPIVVEVLTGGENREVPILRHLLEIDESGVHCWMCFDCLRALERRTLPKFSLANNLWIGDVPSVLSALTIPEQLLIARHYPRCYVFKLFPRDYDAHIPPDQLFTAMAGNASLFEMNTQEVVEMVIGQRMPSAVVTLASVIAITFVGSARLPINWLKKTFRVRREVVYEALKWLHENNPIYADIVIDPVRLKDLPDDDVPEELMSVMRREDDDEVARRECESYVPNEDEMGAMSNEDGSFDEGSFFLFFFFLRNI